MSTLEESVRAAARSAAAQITPDSIRPLDLSRRSDRLARRRAGPLLGLAATAAASALAAAVLVVAAASPTTSPRLAGAAPGSAPRYYVTLTDARQAAAGRPAAGTPVLDAAVRATTSGHALAWVAVPQPFATFRGVTAAADDRTFVLAATQILTAAQPAARTRRAAAGFFLMRYQPGVNAVRLTRLPISVISPAARLQGMALSPDGAQLAVALSGPAIRVYTLRTGAMRAWTVPGAAQPAARLSGLSWTADGRHIAFTAVRWGSRPAGLRILDTARMGGLAARSRLVPRPAGNARCSGPALLAPDGVTAACFLQHGRASPGGPQAWIAEFSARTGRMLRYLPRASPLPGSLRRGPPQLLWISPAGRQLIARARGPAMLISSGQVVTLPASSAGGASDPGLAGALPLAAW